MTDSPLRVASTLTIIGTDCDTTQFWSFDWHDGSAPFVHMVDEAHRELLLTLLSSAQPGIAGARIAAAAGIRSTDSGADGYDARDWEFVERFLGAHGPMATPEREFLFSKAVADLLLPQPVRADIVRRSAAASGDRSNTAPLLRIRVMPAQSCASVPWELMPVDGERRLIEFADIRTIAPLVTRDCDGSSPRRWEDSRDLPALRLVDPYTVAGPVLSLADAAVWQHIDDQLGPAVRQTFVGEAQDRVWLSQALIGTPRSRLLYLGHVESDQEHVRATAMLLSCDLETYGCQRAIRNARGEVTRPFSAQDLAQGTRHYFALVPPAGTSTRDPRVGIATELFGTLTPAVPQAARDGDSVMRLPGSALWPMPPRVALVACASGVDLMYAEPYGLVTAILDAGAELVTASRWTLLTGRAFSRHQRERGEPEQDPLNEAALMIDRLHEQADPFTGLAEWQRGKLRAWREQGRLVDSPVTWAAFSNYDGRPRTVELPADAVEAFERDRQVTQPVLAPWLMRSPHDS